MKNNLLSILFVLSCCGALYTAFDNIRTIHQTNKVKQQLIEYVDRANKTNSMAVESAMKDSINNTVYDWLRDNYKEKTK